MLDSNEGRSIEVTGRSESAGAVEAPRDALSEVLKGLTAAGYGPHHLTTMHWEVPDLAYFHPSRHEIELAYREVFAGFRPPVTLAHAPGPGVRAVAVARMPSRPSSDQPVYGSYSPAALARQYSPRSQADKNTSSNSGVPMGHGSGLAIVDWISLMDLADMGLSIFAFPTVSNVRRSVAA